MVKSPQNNDLSPHALTPKTIKNPLSLQRSGEEVEEEHGQDEVEALRRQTANDDGWAKLTQKKWSTEKHLGNFGNFSNLCSQGNLGILTQQLEERR